MKKTWVITWENNHKTFERRVTSQKDLMEWVLQLTYTGHEVRVYEEGK